MSEEQKKIITKKKSRKILVVGLIAVLVIAVVALFIYVSGSKDRKLKEALQLAEQYLNELDYEKAIAAYEDAINIDPKCVDAYIGITDIYVTMADESESNNDYETAIKDCDSGLENLNRALNLELNDCDTITAKISEVTTKREELQKKLDEQLVAEQKRLKEEQKAKEEEEKKAKLLSNDSDLSAVQVGDIVSYGHKGSFSLNWKVLDVQDDKALLLSEESSIGIPSCKVENIDKNMDFEKYFYDEELEKILVTSIEDTKRTVPKGFNGEFCITQDNYYMWKSKTSLGVGYGPYVNGSPVFWNTDVNSYELENSTINGKEVQFFFLSYDEAKKYAVCDCILRNMIHYEYDNFQKPYNNDYKGELENQDYEYDSRYGYHTESIEYDYCAYIDSEGNLSFLNENDGVRLRPAIWVKIN